MHKLISPAQWITKICKNECIKYESMHFDNFENYIHGSKIGIELLNYACNLLKDAKKICDNINKKFKPMIHFSLGCSENLETWNENKWLDLGKDEQPPDLCLVPYETKGDTYFEYYRSPIDLPFELKEPIVALFQSSRSEEERKNNWEYWESIILYYKGDF